MLHSGSRGLGHQVATDALTAMDRAMARDGIETNDRQLACARINSRVCQSYAGYSTQLAQCATIISCARTQQAKWVMSFKVSSVLRRVVPSIAVSARRAKDIGSVA